MQASRRNNTCRQTCHMSALGHAAVRGASHSRCALVKISRCAGLSADDVDPLERGRSHACFGRRVAIGARPPDSPDIISPRSAGGACRSPYQARSMRSPVAARTRGVCLAPGSGARSLGSWSTRGRLQDWRMPFWPNQQSNTVHGQRLFAIPRLACTRYRARAESVRAR